jgi:hypothetical protein
VRAVRGRLRELPDARVVAPGHVWETGYGYYPTQRQHLRVCRMIARAMKDPGTPLATDGYR